MTPKQMGNHLRAVRRRKGLSLSEVARGAGLNRRELVNYERGKATIPESDLWVLAGSIGVDVTELVPPAPSTDVPAPSDNVPALRNDNSSDTIGDAVAMLRRSTEVARGLAAPRDAARAAAAPRGQARPGEGPRARRDRRRPRRDPRRDRGQHRHHPRVRRPGGRPGARHPDDRAAARSPRPQGEGHRRRPRPSPPLRYQAPVVPPPPPSEPVAHRARRRRRVRGAGAPPRAAAAPRGDVAPRHHRHPARARGRGRAGRPRHVPVARRPLRVQAAGHGREHRDRRLGTAAAAAVRACAAAPTRRPSTWRCAPTTGPSPARPPASPWPAAPAGAHRHVGRRARAPTADGTDGNGWEPPVPTDGEVPSAFWEGTDDWARRRPSPTSGERRTTARGRGVDAGRDDGRADATDAPHRRPELAVELRARGRRPVDRRRLARERRHRRAGVRGARSTASGRPRPSRPSRTRPRTPPTSGASPTPAPTAPPPFGFATAETDADVETLAPTRPTLGRPTGPTATGHWDHTLDPAAVDSGFVVDWGEADDDESDEPTAGQWASTGTWDEPLTPVWEVQTAAFAAADETDEATRRPRRPTAHEAFDVYDAFAADPFARRHRRTRSTRHDVDAATTGADADDPRLHLRQRARRRAGRDLPARRHRGARGRAVGPRPSRRDPSPTAESRPPRRHRRDRREHRDTETETVERRAETPIETELAVAAPVDELPRIVWRADAFGNVDAVDSHRHEPPTPSPNPSPRCSRRSS